LEVGSELFDTSRILFEIHMDDEQTLLFSFSFYMHPGKFTAGTYSHQPLKERKII